ncbi:MAG: CRISPR-associated helicase Cas3' [bacterium]
MFYAHSENNKSEKHSLKEHLERTAELTLSFAPSDELRHLFFLAGLLHDVGKFQDGFQSYLATGKPKTPHAGIGAFLARTVAKQFIPLPFAIKGHHAGMPDKEELVSAFEILEDDTNNIQEVKRRFYESFPEAETSFGEANSLIDKDKLHVECVTRFLFSALTDADWLDTEHHFNLEKTNARIRSTLDYDVFIDALEKIFTELQKKLIVGHSTDTINSLRTKARNETVKRYDAPVGFFSLQLPTGLGKTLISMYWALLHARHHKLKRIIIVLPFINIIDQTSKILKNVFGDDVVLEHHSGIIEEDKDNDKYDENAVGTGSDLSKRLACENWDAPIIVTTSVQFFESLFSNRPFKCRKNHNIAESVVIFDEVQTLPKQYAEPIVVMLKNIVELARTSFLFCTATQPAFQKREGFEGIDTIQPLITKPQKYFKATQRVNYKLMKNLNEVSFDLLTDTLSKETGSFLVIANTKAVTRELYQFISKSGIHEQYYHLSTAMCPHHRKKTIDNIIADLQSRKRIAVFSTQLVEAGVDLDFPCVYRAIAPMDAVIQAAGRCNRNGVLKKGRVVLFNLEHQKMPDTTYKACADRALGMIKHDPELLHRADSFEQYYEELTNLFIDTDKYNITENREKGNFKTVAENFRLIDSPTVSLFIKDYSEESRLLLKEIENSLLMKREHYRKLQQFSVQVYNPFLVKYSNQIEHFKDSLHIWHGTYNDSIGLAPEDVETVF